MLLRRRKVVHDEEAAVLGRCNRHNLAANNSVGTRYQTRSSHNFQWVVVAAAAGNASAAPPVVAVDRTSC
jgi:hypothetical protein